MKRRNTLTAILFLAALAVGFGLMVTAFFSGTGNFRGEVDKLRQDWSTLPAFLKSGAEHAANQDLDRSHLFIALYGGVQRLSGRSVVEDMVPGNTVARLKTGALNFVTLQTPLEAARADKSAAATIALRDRLEEKGIAYLYLQAPQKIERGANLLPRGVEEHSNEGADRFLSLLEAQRVDYLDFRPLFEATEDYSTWFFRTDHHWKPEAAFYAWVNLSDYLEVNYGLKTDPIATNEANYSKIVYEDFFLGSQGKRVGPLYAGTDDITRYAPRFVTNLTYSAPFYAIERTGPFDTSLLFSERIEKRDWFKGNPYTLYAGGDYPVATAVNHLNPEGPRIVLIRDSFGCAFTPFLALSCSTLTTIDVRTLKGDLLETILLADPDLVLTLYTTGSTLQEATFQF